MTAVVVGMRLKWIARSFSLTPLTRVRVALNAARTRATCAELVAPKKFAYSPLHDCARRTVLTSPVLLSGLVANRSFEVASENKLEVSVPHSHGDPPFSRLLW